MVDKLVEVNLPHREEFKIGYDTFFHDDITGG